MFAAIFTQTSERSHINTQRRRTIPDTRCTLNSTRTVKSMWSCYFQLSYVNVKHLVDEMDVRLSFKLHTIRFYFF